MTEFEKLTLAERIERETGIDCIPQVRRRDWKISTGDMSPCGVASTGRDETVMVFIEDGGGSNDKLITRQQFEAEYEVIRLSFECPRPTMAGCHTMTESEKVDLAYQIAEEKHIDLQPLVRRLDWETSSGDPEPCAIAATCTDGCVKLFMCKGAEDGSDDIVIPAEEFERDYTVLYMSLE